MMVNDRYGFGVSAANSISIIDTYLKYDVMAVHGLYIKAITIPN